MYYQNVKDLPKMVRNLPKNAKALYLKAFNNAWDESPEREDTLREKEAHERAWDAVKQEYEKDQETSEWVKIEDASGARHSMHSMRRRSR